MLHRHSRRGFSLMELAVVLVVVALITAGAFAGKQLLDRTKSKSLATDMESITQAIANF